MPLPPLGLMGHSYQVVGSLWVVGKPLPKSLSPQQPLEICSSQRAMISRNPSFLPFTNGPSETFLQTHKTIRMGPRHGDLPREGTVRFPNGPKPAFRTSAMQVRLFSDRVCFGDPTESCSESSENHVSGFQTLNSGLGFLSFISCCVRASKGSGTGAGVLTLPALAW